MMSIVNSSLAVQAENLTRRYGDRDVVDRVSFQISGGEIFGFLGPNGAGKSTTSRMLTGFIAPTAGQVHIAGVDIAQHPSRARRHIGVVPEEANVYGDLSVRDNVMLMADLHGVGAGERRTRADELIERLDLAAHASKAGRDLSKGLRQRLMLCMALVSKPEILFLDEPTSGLDVASTRLIRDIVAELNRERGMTVFLTTHNMEEADLLCHRVAIIDKGKLVVIDTPTVLRSRMESRRSVEVRFGEFSGRPADILPDLAQADGTVFPGGFRSYTATPGALAQQIVVRASEMGLSIVSIATLEPTLEDVFLSLTSHTKAAPQVGSRS